MSGKLSECNTFSENPFLEQVRDNKVIQSKDHNVTIPMDLLVSDPSGNHVSHAHIRKNLKKYSDHRDFIRIPIDGFRAMATLEKTELKILCYIFENLIYGELFVEIPIEEVKAYYSYTSRNPIYSGITGLIEKELIARRKYDKSSYYINPLYFYKGTIVKSFFNWLKDGNFKQTKKIKSEDIIPEKQSV
jgi:hypothetical protein